MEPFPTTCKFCSAIGADGPSVCYDCARRVVHPISKNTCLKCAQVMNGTHCTNRECSDGLNVFGRVYAFGVKDGSLQEAILAFKDNPHLRVTHGCAAG